MKVLALLLVGLMVFSVLLQARTVLPKILASDKVEYFGVGSDVGSRSFCSNEVEQTSIYSQTVESLGVPPIEWSKQYGGTSNDRAWSVVQASDGGYLIVGDTQSYGAGSDDFWIVKTDSSGNKIDGSSKFYGGSSYDRARSVARTYDGGYVVAGYTSSYGAGVEDFWILKIDASGNKQWSQTFGGSKRDRALSIVQSSDGRYMIAGFTLSFGAGNEDALLLKIDSLGQMSYVTYGGANTDIATCIIQTSDCGFAIAGYTNSYGSGSYDFWLLKTDYAGGLQWSKTYGGPGSDMAYSVAQTDDGGYILAGDTTPFGSTNTDFWLVRTYSDGTQWWSQPYGGTGYDSANSVIQTCDGGYLVAGETTSKGSGGEDFWLIKTNSGGAEEWSQTYGGGGSEIANCAVQARDGGYVVVGSSSSAGAGLDDFWAIKLVSQWSMNDLGILPKLQHKDTKMLCLENCSLYGVHAWDAPHPSKDCLHDNWYCVRASVSVINSYYGGWLSEDRISFHVFHEQVANPAPENDLGHGLGISDDPLLEALSWSLNGAAIYTSSDTPTFAQIKDWINSGCPIVCRIPGAPWHAVVIDGYEDAGQKVHVLDPTNGFETSKAYPSEVDIRRVWVPPATGVTARSDEDWNSNGMPDTMEDSDNDGVCDFDEIYRFFTLRDAKDTDGDGVPDKAEIISYTFLGDGSWDALDVRKPNPDGDFDGQGRPLRAERDYDSDNGGVPDGLEDKNGNGFVDPGETDPLNASDDPNPIHLESMQDNTASINYGTVEFDGITYSLPKDITKPAKTYGIKYNADLGYSFDHWEVTLGISVVNPNSQSTTATVTGGGTLRAVYKVVYVVHLESKEDSAASSNFGSITFDGSTYSLPNDVAKAAGHYPVAYIPKDSSYTFVRWESSSPAITVDDPNKAQTYAKVNNAGTLRAIYKQAPPPTYSVHLESRQNTSSTITNVGTITFDGTLYSLPSDVPKAAGSYSALYTATAGFMFDQWEVTSGVSVSSPTANPTTVTVASPGGTLRARYKVVPPTLYPVHLESRQNTSSTVTNLGKINDYSLPADISKVAGTYTINYTAVSGYVFDSWEVSGTGITVADPLSRETTVTISSSGTSRTLRAVYKAVVATYPVHLESRQNTSATVNLGSIVFDGSSYSLPADISRATGSYGINYSAVSGYVFDHWETSGGISVANANSRETTAVVSSTGTLRAVYSAGTSNQRIEVGTYLFYTSEEKVGDNFTVSILVLNWSAPSVYGYELKINYDNTILQAISAGLPAGHWLTPVLKATNIVIVDAGTIDHLSGYVSFAAALLAPEQGKTGSGLLATVTFKILRAPSANETLSCELGLRDVIFVDPGANPIEQTLYTLTNGHFVFKYQSGKRTDLNRDGKVDIVDISIVATAYGSKPGDPRWNLNADLDGNNEINILDVVLVAKDYGWKASNSHLTRASMLEGRSRLEFVVLPLLFDLLTKACYTRCKNRILRRRLS